MRSAQEEPGSTSSEGEDMPKMWRHCRPLLLQCLLSANSEVGVKCMDKGTSASWTSIPVKNQVDKLLLNYFRGMLYSCTLILLWFSKLILYSIFFSYYCLFFIHIPIATVEAMLIGSIQRRWLVITEILNRDKCQIYNSSLVDCCL